MRASEVEEMEARFAELYAEIDSLTDQLIESKQELETVKVQFAQMMSDRSLVP